MVASNGDVYIADSNHHVIRRIDARTTNIAPVAVNHSSGSGFAGDNGPATAAQLDTPGLLSPGPVSKRLERTGHFGDPAAIELAGCSVPHGAPVGPRPLVGDGRIEHAANWRDVEEKPAPAVPERIERHGKGCRTPRCDGAGWGRAGDARSGT